VGSEFGLELDRGDLGPVLAMLGVLPAESLDVVAELQKVSVLYLVDRWVVSLDKWNPRRVPWAVPGATLASLAVTQMRDH